MENNNKVKHEGEIPSTLEEYLMMHDVLWVNYKCRLHFFANQVLELLKLGKITQEIRDSNRYPGVNKSNFKEEKFIRRNPNLPDYMFSIEGVKQLIIHNKNNGKCRKLKEQFNVAIIRPKNVGIDTIFPDLFED